MGMIMSILGWRTSGPLDRIFDTIDKRVDAKTDREKLKADIVTKHIETRPDYMDSGGFFLMLLFAAPLVYWFGSVVLYSVHWCADCANPKPWTVAALPPPLDEWAGAIIVSIFGVIGVSRFRRR